jgi:hypothetical protein
MYQSDKATAAGWKPRLPEQVTGNRHVQSAKLNPHWVMTLMGYPPLWAEIGRKFTTACRNSKRQVTQSCRK